MAPAARGPRLFLAGAFLSSSPLPTSVQVPPDVTRHLRDALRLRIGDLVELCNPRDGAVAEARVASLTPSMVLEVFGEVRQPAPPRTHIHLYAALCKGQKNELIIDWATELGCSSITLFEAERSIVRLKTAADSATKAERFSKIAWAAAEQSRQRIPPTVRVTRGLSELLAENPQSQNSVRMWGSLSDSARPLSFLQSNILEASSVHLLIGPEGDLAPSEEALLAQAGFIPITLGERVLRSELAVVTSIVALRLAIGDGPRSPS